MNPLAQLIKQEFFEATQAVDEFERQLEVHPSRDKWTPHLMALAGQVEVAFQANDRDEFDSALRDLGDYIWKVQREMKQSQ